MILFKSFKSWKNYFLSAVKNVFIGFARILWSVISGLISILAFIWRSIKDFCRREFWAALVIGIVAVIIIAGWLCTFACERAARVTAEFQRDSLAVKLDSAKQYNRSVDRTSDSLLTRNTLAAHE